MRDPGYDESLIKEKIEKGIRAIEMDFCRTAAAKFRIGQVIMKT